MTTIVLGARFVLAAVFAVAAVGKLAAPGSTRRAVIGFGVPERLALPTAVAVVAAEGTHGRRSDPLIDGDGRWYRRPGLAGDLLRGCRVSISYGVGPPTVIASARSTARP